MTQTLASASAALAAALSDPPIAWLLLNAEAAPDAEVVVARCREFVEFVPPDTEALIVTLLHAPPRGLDHFPAHAAIASLWAFTREAALEWAPRRIRVNAIGLGVSPAGPFEPAERAGRASGPGPAEAASVADLADTIRAMAIMPSMTGQIIRLGA